MQNIQNMQISGQTTSDTKKEVEPPTFHKNQMDKTDKTQEVLRQDPPGYPSSRVKVKCMFWKREIGKLPIENSQKY